MKRMDATPNPRVILRSQCHSPDFAAARLFVLVRQEGDLSWIAPARDGQGDGEAQGADDPPDAEAHRVPTRTLRYAVAGFMENKLIDAVFKKHHKKVAALLDADPLLDPNGDAKNTLIHAALWRDSGGTTGQARLNKTLDVLIQHGADIDMPVYDDSHGPQWTALWQAVHDNSPSDAQRLMDRGANLDYHPAAQPRFKLLDLAASCGHMDMMGWLLTKGVQDTGRSALNILKKDPPSFSSWYKPFSGAQGVELPLLHRLAIEEFKSLNNARRMLDWMLAHGERWDEEDPFGLTSLQAARLRRGSAAVVFEERAAQMELGRLQVDTPTAQGGLRKPARL